MHLPPGRRAAPLRLGPYELTDELGRGGMGVVYRGRHRELGVERALKVLERLEPKALARFEREAAHLARIQHPNVIAIHDVGVEDGRPWLAMTLAEGQPLSKLLEGERLGLERALRLTAGIAEGVAALHAAGVVHRDLKPANVFVTPDDRPLVLDLGLAVAPGLDQRLTKTGTTLGTVAYMAPEQFHGSEAAGPPTDVYALGSILFELTTGRPAVAHGSTQEMAAAILTEERPRPTAVDPELPVGLDRVVAQATARDPARRPPDAAAFGRALAALVADPGPSRRAVTRRRTLLGALLGGAALAVAVGLLARPEPAAEPALASATPRSPTASPAESRPQDAAPDRAAPRTPGRPWRYLRHPACRGVAFVDDRRLMSWGRGGVVLWDVEEDRALQRWSSDAVVTAGAVASDRRRIAYANQKGVFSASPEGSSARLLYAFEGTPRPFPRTLAFSPGGTQLAVAGRHDPAVRLLEVSRGKLLSSLGEHRAKIDQVAFSADGKLLVSACGESLDDRKNMDRDHAVRVFDLASGSLRARYPFAGQANSVAFHPSLPRVAVAADGQAVVLIDLETGARTQLEGSDASKGSLLIAAHAGVAREVAYTPDGRYLLSASDGPIQRQNELRVWDAVSGAELGVLRELPMDREGISGLALSRSGRDVALSHTQGVWVYDVQGLLSSR